MDGLGRQTEQVDVRPGGERTQDLGICGRGHSGRSRARRKGRKLLEERSRIEVVRTRRRRSQGSWERGKLRGKEEKIRVCTESGNLLPRICTYYCTPDHRIVNLLVPF